MKIISESEVLKVTDVLDELVALVDPCDYSREEVKELITMLNNLKTLTVQKIM